MAAAFFILLSNWLMSTYLVEAPKKGLLDGAALCRLDHFEKDFKGKVEENGCSNNLSAEA